jgi:glycosyltransferase involved in cell wall biosynthesis
MQAHYSWNQRFFDRIWFELSEENYDVVHVEHLRGVRYGLRIEQRRQAAARNYPPVVWDSVDCISLLCSHAAKASAAITPRLVASAELSRTRRYEAQMTDQFRRIVVTSETDRTALLELPRHRSCGSLPHDGETRDLRIKVIPNGVDLEYFSPGTEQLDPRRIVFSGKMSYHANVTAAVSLVREVMPRVWQNFPDVSLWIVGKDPSALVRSLVKEDPLMARGKPSRVTVTGTVDDIRPYLRCAAVAVAPLRYAVGIQNKVLEAMACGTPVVASQAACAALKAQHGTEILVARDPNQMAESVLSVLTNSSLRRDLAIAGRRFAEQTHNWAKIAASLADVYRGASLA